jgi:hemerythrin-like domain-containing protein
MDVIEILERDHRSVEDLVQRWEGGMEAGAARLDLLREILDEVSAHRALEERMLFPVVAEELPGGRELVDAEAARHAEAEPLIADLVAVDEIDQKVERKTEQLVGHIREHTRQDEERLVPGLREHVSPERRERLGTEAERAGSGLRAGSARP